MYNEINNLTNCEDGKWVKSADCKSVVLLWEFESLLHNIHKLIFKLV